MQVITETLRIGNIISGIMRKAVRDVEMKGNLIPKGWCVFVYFRSVHLGADIYDDPYAFNPWRWKVRSHPAPHCIYACISLLICRTCNDVLIGNPWTFLQERDMMGSSGFTPFGGGQRLCPGLDLARLEASVFLHHLVTNFRYIQLACMHAEIMQHTRETAVECTPVFGTIESMHFYF